MKNKANTYNALFKSDLGVKVLKDLEDRFFNTSCYAKGDPYHTAFLEGQREVIRYMKSVIAQTGDNEE